MFSYREIWYWFKNGIVEDDGLVRVGTWGIASVLLNQSQCRLSYRKTAIQNIVWSISGWCRSVSWSQGMHASLSLAAENLVCAWLESYRVLLESYLRSPLCSQIQFGQNLLAVQMNLNWDLRCSSISVLGVRADLLTGTNGLSKYWALHFGYEVRKFLDCSANRWQDGALNLIRVC